MLHLKQSLKYKEGNVIGPQRAIIDMNKCKMNFRDNTGLKNIHLSIEDYNTTILRTEQDTT